MRHGRFGNISATQIAEAASGMAVLGHALAQLSTELDGSVRIRGDVCAELAELLKNTAQIFDQLAIAVESDQENAR